jgi:hypothetical protein
VKANYAGVPVRATYHTRTVAFALAQDVLWASSSRTLPWSADAAHVMLTVVAIQDAVAAAHVVGRRLKTGEVRQQDPAAIQR